MNRLSAELFEQITASLRSDRSQRSNEKRRKPRVGLRSSLDVYPCTTTAIPTQARALVVWVRDVSADGLGLVTSKPLIEDSQFIAEFDRMEPGRLRVQYRVAYCKMISKGLFSIGAKLVAVLASTEEPRHSG